MNDDIDEPDGGANEQERCSNPTDAECKVNNIGHCVHSNAGKQDQQSVVAPALWVDHQNKANDANYRQESVQHEVKG